MKFFSLIHQGDIHTAADEKVIPASEYSTLLSAVEILEKVQQDAEQLRRDTDEECKRLKNQAKEEGFQEGLNQFSEHILAFENEIKRLRHEMQQAVLPIALKAAKKIIGKELQQFPETIVDIILQAIAPAIHSHRITIYVNKADKEHVEASKTRIKKILEQVQSLSVQERADVSPGGCIIETEAGIINATIENQWRALEAAFERYTKQ